MLKGTIRLVAGVGSLLLVLFGNAILKEAAGSYHPSADSVQIIGIALLLAGGLLAFGVFFRWNVTRAVLSVTPESAAAATVRHHARMLGGFFIALGLLALGGVVGLLFLLAEFGKQEEMSVVVAIAIVFSLLLIAIGVGLWKERPWARVAGLLSGFVLFGGLPIGTALALYVWWFTASPTVRLQFSGGAATPVAAPPRITALRLIGNIALSILLLLALAIPLLSILSEGGYIDHSTAWALLAVTYLPALFYLWLSATHRTRLRLWLSREWRVLPFYVAAILFSIAALRYILSK